MPHHRPAVWDQLALAYWPSQARLVVRRNRARLSSLPLISRILILARAVGSLLLLVLFLIAGYLSLYYVPRHPNAVTASMVALMTGLVIGASAAMQLTGPTAARRRLLIAALGRARSAVVRPGAEVLLSPLGGKAIPDSVASRRDIWRRVVSRQPSIHQSTFTFALTLALCSHLAMAAILILPVLIKISLVSFTVVLALIVIASAGGLVVQNLRIRRWRRGARDADRGLCPRCACDLRGPRFDDGSGPARCPSCGERWPLVPPPPPAAAGIPLMPATGGIA